MKTNVIWLSKTFFAAAGGATFGLGAGAAFAWATGGGVFDRRRLRVGSGFPAGANLAAPAAASLFTSAASASSSFARFLPLMASSISAAASKTLRLTTALR